MKRVIFFVLLFFALQVSAVEWTDGNGTKWSFEVSGTTATDIRIELYYLDVTGEIEVPGIVYDGQTALTVTSIGSFAFEGCLHTHAEFLADIAAARAEYAGLTGGCQPLRALPRRPPWNRRRPSTTYRASSSVVSRAPESISEAARK